MKKFTSWSFTRYSTHKQCPLKAKLQHLDKIPEPKSMALERGAKIHELAEQYIKGQHKRIPKELTKFTDLFKSLKRQYATKPETMFVEEMWAFDKGWNPRRWDDWNNCVVRIKLDVAHLYDGVLWVIDWKTGKFRPDNTADYEEQLELYALAALLKAENVPAIPRLAYLDVGVEYPKDEDLVTYTSKDIPRLKELWSRRVKAMLADEKFSPTANRFCSWCWYRKANAENFGGGKCQF